MTESDRSAEETTPPPSRAEEAPTLAPTAPVSTAASPAVVPGYEIVRELGRGGMGVVYEARQTSLGRTVALKMILSGAHAGATDLVRFRTEAEAIARLSHPNIVQIHEVGDCDGRPYFSLEFCDGGSLERRLVGGTPPPRDAAALVELLARAVHAAHEKGVVHRDLKPANVLLMRDGTPKIADFGLAKKLEEKGQTATGSVMGTPSYMAPEQAEARKDVGPLADVYALGAVLYECLAGRPPFRAPTPLDTLMQVVSEPPLPPRHLRPDIPKELEAICLKCLEKSPPRRYASAAELAADLRRFLDGEAVLAHTSGLLGQLAGSLERVQLQGKFAGYGTLLLWLAPVMLLPELWVTAVVALDGPARLLPVAQFGRVAVFLILVGRHRGWRWQPAGAAERHLWAVWGSYLAACFVTPFSGRLAAWAFTDTGIEVRYYQALSALTAVAFFSLSTTLWGYCAVIGTGFLLLPLLMAADLRWAPAEFGMLWAVVLLVLGSRLRRLARQDEPEAAVADASASFRPGGKR